jgi:hypothetical protein
MDGPPHVCFVLRVGVLDCQGGVAERGYYGFGLVSVRAVASGRGVDVGLGGHLAVVAALADPDRDRDAIVIRECDRAVAFR